MLQAPPSQHFPKSNGTLRAGGAHDRLFTVPLWRGWQWTKPGIRPRAANEEHEERSVKQTGPYISKHGAEKSGFKNLAATHWNYRPAALYEEAIRRGEGNVAANGPHFDKTGVNTGRSSAMKCGE